MVHIGNVRLSGRKVLIVEVPDSASPAELARLRAKQLEKPPVERAYSTTRSGTIQVKL